MSVSADDAVRLRAREVTVTKDREPIVRKPGSGVPPYTRWVNRPLGLWIARGAARIGVSPTAVSILGFLLTISGLGLLVAGPSVTRGISAAALMILGYVLDSADGQLARMTGMSSSRGEWLDHVLDAVRLPLTHVVIAIGLSQVSPVLALIAVLGSVVVSSDFFSQNVGTLIRERAGSAATPLSQAGGTLRTWLNLPKDPGTLNLLIIAWGWPMVFGVGYLVLITLLAAAGLVAAMRRWQQLKVVDLSEG